MNIYKNKYITQKLNNRGFTIVELLIVIVVIGILAGLVLVGYNGITKRSYESSLQHDLSNGTKVLDIERTRQRKYPTTLDNVELLSSKGNTFTYYTSTDSQKFCLQSMHEGMDSYYITNDKKSPQKGSCGDFLAVESPPTPPAPPTPPIPANCNGYTTGSTGPGGGVIVYRAATPQSWGCYIEAANAGGWWHTDAEPQYVWGCRGVDIPTPETAIGGGMMSTMRIADSCDQYTAADKARSFDGGGLADWYLPNRSEMVELMKFQSQLGIKNGSGWMAATYWTSTQLNAEMGVNFLTHGTNCWILCVTINDTLTQEVKDNAYWKYVRPVRKF